MPDEIAALSAGVSLAWNSANKTTSEKPQVANPLRKVFAQIDSNGSGNVSTAEVTWALQTVGLSAEAIDAQLEAFRACSKDLSELEGGAENVSLAEWEKGLLPETRAAIEARLTDAGTIEGFEAVADYSPIYKRLMQHFDMDGSGKLTVAELKRALEALRMGSAKARHPRRSQRVLEPHRNRMGCRLPARARRDAGVGVHGALWRRRRWLHLPRRIPRLALHGHARGVAQSDDRRRRHARGDCYKGGRAHVGSSTLGLLYLVVACCFADYDRYTYRSIYSKM